LDLASEYQTSPTDTCYQFFLISLHSAFYIN
jgi:hypothetical protein